MVDVSEKNFEAQIEHVLWNVNRYESRTSTDYDLTTKTEETIAMLQAYRAAVTGKIDVRGEV